MSQINYFFEGIKSCKHQLPPKKWIRACLTKEKREFECINFIFSSDSYLQKLNTTYLNKSYLTDVISFSYTKRDSKNLISGDVFISVDRVRENKLLYKTIFAKELQRVMIHGVLHLIGYNDSTREEREIMTLKENLYINLL